ncbi:hypothetical protein AAMO2058_000710200 [Amorphochlora amoebiformis]
MRFSSFSAATALFFPVVAFGDCDFKTISYEAGLEDLGQLTEPVLMKGALTSDISFEGFIKKYGALEVIPRASLELEVDGRISLDDPKKPRPSVSISAYLHQRSQNLQVERVLYGQMLSASDIDERIKTLKAAEKDVPEGKPSVTLDDLNKDLLPKDYLSDLKLSALYVGRENSALPFQSHQESYHISITGANKWFVYPPGEIPKEVRAHFILAEMDGEYLSELEGDMRPKTCEQDEGDILFIPKYYSYARVSELDSITVAKMQPHTPVKPKSGDETTAKLTAEIEKFPKVHQLYVDRALSVLGSNPDNCIADMKKAVEVSPYNLALSWQVARLMSRIGAKGEALNLGSKTLKILTDASGAGAAEKTEEEVHPDFGVVSEQKAKIHWSKFGQLLLYDLQMPLESIVCFQMRLRISPDDIPTILLKARALTMLGALEEAKTALREGLHYDADNQQLKSMLEELDSDEAKNLAETMRAMRSSQGSSEDEAFSKEALKAILKNQPIRRPAAGKK